MQRSDLPEVGTEDASALCGSGNSNVLLNGS